MKFEIDSDVIKDMVATLGKEAAIKEIVSGFRAGIETIVEALDEKDK